MGIMDVLRQYTNPTETVNPDAAADHFDEVARYAPPEAVGQGVADAFRSDNTPPFEEMVGQMFGRSNPQQQAGAINQILASIGPGVLAALGSGALGRMLGQRQTDGSPPQLTPEQATQLTPEQMQELATRAREQDPGIMDQLGNFYAKHPDLVKTLGSAALAIALAGVSKRMRR